jgi:phasin family protein
MPGSVDRTSPINLFFQEEITMNFTPEQFTANQQAGVEACQTIANQAFTSLEKMVELNLAATKALLGDSFAHAQAVLGAKDVQQVISVQTGLIQPLTEKSVAYSRHVYAIGTDASAGISETAESQWMEAQKTFSSLVENMFKNAPAGSESAVAVFKNALTSGQNAIEVAQSSAKKAMEMAETNFNAATEQAVKVASKTKA